MLMRTNSERCLKFWGFP